MAFWSDAILEPKRKHKFLVTIGTLPQILAKSVNKPNFDISMGEHKFLGNSYKFPGGIKWNDITVTFVDTSTDQIAYQLYDALKLAGNQTPQAKGAALAGTTPLTLFEKASATSVLGNNVLIEQLEADGKSSKGSYNVVEKWRLYNAWISKIDLGELSYENDNQLSEYKLTIVYDWAEIVLTSDAASKILLSKEGTPPSTSG